MRYTVFLAAICLTGSAGFGQPGAKPAFDVASVKVHRGAVPPGGGRLTTSGPRLTIECYSILDLIVYAYDVKPYQILNASALDHTMYDISAVASGAAPTAADFRGLLRSLLEERFKLKAHRDLRNTPVYALVVGKSGAKFKESAPDAGGKRTTTSKGPNFQTSMSKATMDTLADYLRANAGLDRPVMNLTGLSGEYDIELTYTPEYRIQGRTDVPDAIPAAVAVQEQLGLKLDKRDLPVEMLVIDHIEKPSEN